MRGSSRHSFVLTNDIPLPLRYIDPTLEHELTSKTKPWALSPLISTMPHFAHQKIGKSDALPEFPPRESLEDDNSHLSDAVEDPIEREKLSPQLAKIKTADQRRAHFADKDARESITFGPDVGSAQCHPFLPMFHANDIASSFTVSPTPGPDHNRFLLRLSRVRPRTGAQNSGRNLL